MTDYQVTEVSTANSSEKKNGEKTCGMVNRPTHYSDISTLRRRMKIVRATPMGWDKFRSRETGRVYFWNSVTNE